MRLSIKETIMGRDKLSEEEADELISQAKDELIEIISTPGMCLSDAEAVVEDYFGLEPDYLDELLPM